MKTKKTHSQQTKPLKSQIKLGNIPYGEDVLNKDKPADKNIQEQSFRHQIIQLMWNPNKVPSLREIDNLRIEIRKQTLEEVREKIEDMIDYYTPYRPISDSCEMQFARHILCELLEKLK